jgi:hypothetical protein
MKKSKTGNVRLIIATHKTWQTAKKGTQGRFILPYYICSIELASSFGVKG